MINLKRKLVALVLALSPLICNASETKYSVGFGAQYGGLGGIQIAQVSNTGITRIAGGLLGFAVGHDRFISTNVSLGAQIFHLTVLSGVGLNMNYHFGSRQQSNLVLGVDAGLVKIMDGFMGTPADNELIVFISAGYRF